MPIRSHNASAISKTCVDNIVVTPCVFSSCSKSFTILALLGSKALIGSSRINSLGLCKNAEINEIFFFMPSE